MSMSPYAVRNIRFGVPLGTNPPVSQLVELSCNITIFAYDLVRRRALAGTDRLGLQDSHGHNG